MTTTDYTEQAQAFLSQYGISFRAKLSDTKPCPWKDDDNIAQGPGHHYRITLKRIRPLPSGSLYYGSPAITFDFWGSTHDAQIGKTELDAYDVLACISSDAQEYLNFKGWCEEFGYDQDSIKALKTYKRAEAFSKKLRAFFTPQEITALQEIQ